MSLTYIIIIVSNELESDLFINKMIDGSAASLNHHFNLGLDDLDPKLGELLYSDKPLNQKEIDLKGRWI